MDKSFLQLLALPIPVFKKQVKKKSLQLKSITMSETMNISIRFSVPII